MHIGEKIKMARRIRSLTQDELGNKINKTRAAVSFIEQTGKVNHFTLKAILKVLNISEEDLNNIKQKSQLMLEPGSVNESLKAENEALRLKINALNKQLETQNEHIKSLQKLVSVLERKKK
jgi:transcriptional regulator with XRE-family HTH domain